MQIVLTDKLEQLLARDAVFHQRKFYHIHITEVVEGVVWVVDSVSRKELLELIRQHYLHTGSALAGRMLDNFSKYIEDFIQVVPIEYKRVLEEEKMARLHEKIADIQRDY